MSKVILENKFTTHQKITILLYIGGPIVLFIAALLVQNLNFKGYIMLCFLILVCVFLVFLAFAQKGFAKINSKLYRCTFLNNRLFFKKRIDFSESPKVAILKFKKSQKLAWFSAAKPDLASNFNFFEINILNENHTEREPIINLKNLENSNQAVDFLETNFNLTAEVYSPRFR